MAGRAGGAKLVTKLVVRAFGVQCRGMDYSRLAHHELQVPIYYAVFLQNFSVECYLNLVSWFANRFVCDDIPELMAAMQKNVLNDFDTKR